MGFRDLRIKKNYRRLEEDSKREFEKKKQRQKKRVHLFWLPIAKFLVLTLPLHSDQAQLSRPVLT
jgi:hypothetical protein